MIPSEIVEQACSEVGDYSDDRMLEEFDLFFQEQPAVCDFVVELTRASSRQIQEMALFLSYMVFKAARLDSPIELPAITVNGIEAAYRESEHWIDLISNAREDLGNTGNAGGQAAIVLPQDTEPHLIQYVIAEINQPMENGALLEDEEKGEVFFVLKTVISSLSTLSRRPLGKEA